MSCCSDDLKELLKSWKLENIFTHLVAQDIDVEVLRILKPSHLESLLYSFTLGTQIRFEHNLEKWRCDIGKPLKYQNNQQFGNHLQLKRIVQNILNEINGQSTNESRNDSVSKSNNSKYPLIDLKSIILQYPPDGPEIFEIYHKKKNFSSPERKFLINLIVRHYVEHDLDFNLNISYAIEEAILRLFPNESLDMYRNGEQGIVYNKYLEYKVENNKQELIEITVDSKIEEISNASNEETKQEQSVFPAADNHKEESDKPTEIVLQTLCNGCKRFVKIFEPYSYKGFILAACLLFDISSTRDYYIAVNGCEISEDEFKNVILQYYKLPAFIIELKKKVIPVIYRNLNKSIDDFENSRMATNIFEGSLDSSTPTKSYEPQTVQNNSYMSGINTYLPNANDIRNIPALMHIVKLSEDGKMLENKHRSAIAKAIIDECLNTQPDRVLRRQDFYILTDNLIKVFPKEVLSTYFIPSQNKEHARGKLWNAYTNKRRYFINAEILEPRPKRKHQSDAESEKTNDKIYVTDYSWENNEFSLNTTLDWSTLQHKWSRTHRERRDELLKGKLQPEEYMNKYSILKSNRGIELMEIDVNILYPTVVGIDNWLLSYKRIVEKGHQLTNMETLNQMLSSIDNSNNERYRASLALLIIPYIFPSTSRSSDRNRKDIQKRFIKEYKSLEDLKSDTDCHDLQIRFVHSDHQINYAEFTICDNNFKCVDLLEALSTTFNYTVALNLEYPRTCLHIWQFIQLAIFQIEIPEVLEPNVMSTFNDLYGK